MKKTVVLIAFAAAALSAQATDWYLKQKENDGSHNSFFNAGQWRMRNVSPATDGTNGDSLNPDDTYAVIWSYFLRAKAPNNSSPASFEGKRLTIEKGYLLQYEAGSYGTYFNNDGLVLQEGSWYYAGGVASKTSTIHGDIEVVSPASNPFCLAANTYGNAFVFESAFSSASTAALCIGVGKNNSAVEIGTNMFSVALNGSCADYLGTFAVTSRCENTATTYGTRLTVGTPLVGGTIAMSRGTMLELSGDLSTLTVGSLALSGRGRVVFAGGLQSIVVTNSLSVADAPVTIEADLPSSCVPSAGATNRISLLTVPLAATLDAEDFVLAAMTNDVTLLASYSGLEVVEGNGTKSLVAVFHPVVTLLTGDTGTTTYPSGGTSASSLTQPSHWSDGLSVHPGAAYLLTKIDGTGRNLLTPGPLNQECEFQGDSLTVDTGCSLFHFNSSFVVPLLRFRAGSSLTVGNGAGGIISGGKVILESGQISMSAYAGRNMKVESEVEGSAKISFGRVGGTGSPQANNEFTQMNTNFFGTFYVGQNIEPDMEKKFQTLWVSDERNLGGRLPSFDFKALHLERMSRLRTRASFALTPDYNRGVYVNHLARFYADADMTLGMDTTLTLNGKLVKEGPGVLSMGGTVKFLTAQSAPGDTPRANSNLLEVAEGTLKVVAAEAVDGLAVSLDSGTRLVLSFDGGDLALRERGIVNVKSAEPFALDASFGGVMPFSVELPGEYVPSDGDTFGLFTVATTALADDVKSMLPRLRTGLRGWRMETFAREDAATGGVTIAARLKPSGFMLVVQ